MADISLRDVKASVQIWKLSDEEVFSRRKGKFLAEAQRRNVGAVVISRGRQVEDNVFGSDWLMDLLVGKWAYWLIGQND